MDWELHLQRWVIEDGNPELHVGDTFDWAIAFRAENKLGKSAEHKKSAGLINRDCYRVNAEVIYISKDPRYKCCILDFGIMAVSELGRPWGIPLSRECREGDYVAGDIWLEMPLCFDVVPYKLGRRWRVNRIAADLTTFNASPADHRTPQYPDIPGTDSVNVGSYLLHCSDLGGPALRAGRPPIVEEALNCLKPFRADLIEE